MRIEIEIYDAKKHKYHWSGTQPTSQKRDGILENLITINVAVQYIDGYTNTIGNGFLRYSTPGASVYLCVCFCTDSMTTPKFVVSFLTASYIVDCIAWARASVCVKPFNLLMRNKHAEQKTKIENGVCWDVIGNLLYILTLATTTTTTTTTRK